MCCIMGYAGHDLPAETFTKYLLRTASRGPDDHRVCRTEFGLLGFGRLAIMGLTEAGMHIGRDIAHRHIVIQEFFQHILQLEPNVSNDVACELEHVIPPDVIRRLGQFVLYLRSREDDWKNWQEDYKEIRLEHIQSNTDRDLVRNAPPMLAMRTQMMGQDELRKKYR